MEGRFQSGPEASRSCSSLPGRPRWSTEKSGNALRKEEREWLQPGSGLMQFPVGVALRDLANFAAGQKSRAISQQSPSIAVRGKAAI